MKSDSQPYMQSETGKEEATAGEATINYQSQKVSPLEQLTPEESAHQSQQSHHDLERAVEDEEEGHLGDDNRISVYTGAHHQLKPLGDDENQNEGLDLVELAQNPEYEKIKNDRRAQ